LLVGGAGPFLRTAPAGAAAGSVQYGFHMDISYLADPAVRQTVISKDAAIGSEIGRNTFSMAHIQPKRGEYDWTRIDSIIGRMRAAGMQRLFVVSGSPKWANGSSDRFYVPQLSLLFNRWVSDYAAFMRVAASRYRGQMWELGNEPNEYYFWKPQPKVAQYVRWYSALRTAILAVDPTAKVSVGGLTGLSQSCCIRGADFLRGILAAGVPIDRLAIHPYTRFSPDDHVPFETNFDDIALIHDILEGAGRHNIPLWVTEWGWDVDTLAPQTLAAYLRRSLELIEGRYTYVTVATYFQDRDSGQNRYGVYDAAFHPRPSAAAFKDFVNPK
jgi:hypothetical protein